MRLGGSMRSNCFQNIMKILLPFHSHCLMSVWWSFPDAVCYQHRLNAEADRRIQLNSIPQTFKRL